MPWLMLKKFSIFLFRNIMIQWFIIYIVCLLLILHKKTNPKIFDGKFSSKPGLGVAVNSFTIRVNVR